MLISRWISKRYPDSQTILAIAVLTLSIAGSASFARADGEVALMNRVNSVLRGNDRLNGAKAYTAAPGVIVLYGMVFDDKDRALAERSRSQLSTKLNLSRLDAPHESDLAKELSNTVSSASGSKRWCGLGGGSSRPAA